MGRYVEVSKISTLWLLRGLIFIGSYAVFFNGAYPIWRQFTNLSERGVRTKAKVIAKEPSNHQSIRYEFKADEKNYTGHGNGGNLKFERIMIGDEIIVTYLPDDPYQSVPGSPKQLRREWTALLFILLPAACLFLTFSVRQRSVIQEDPAIESKTK